MMRVPLLKIDMADGKLRPLELEDAEDLSAITDESVTSKIDFLPENFDIEDAKILIAKNGTADCFFGIRSLGDDALIGVIGVHACGAMQYEIGTWFAQSVRGSGVAGRCLAELVQQLAMRCPGCTILAECAPANVKSWAMLRRIGFAPTGSDGKRAGRRMLRWYAMNGAGIDVC